VTRHDEPVTASGAPPAARRPVVIGFDGSPGARAALTWAAEEAELRRCELRVVHVDLWDPSALAVPAFHDQSGIERTILGEGIRRAQAAVPGLAVSGRRESPPAGEALVRAGGGAALLVVGARSLTQFERWVLGSVSRYCVEHAPCPVVVVPTSAGGPRGVRAG
jgi:nucleotide-binding universal stress UspA family protein